MFYYSTIQTPNIPEPNLRRIPCLTSLETSKWKLLKMADPPFCYRHPQGKQDLLATSLETPTHFSFSPYGYPPFCSFLRRDTAPRALARVLINSPTPPNEPSSAPAWTCRCPPPWTSAGPCPSALKTWRRGCSHSAPGAEFVAAGTRKWKTRKGRNTHTHKDTHTHTQTHSLVLASKSLGNFRRWAFCGLLKHADTTQHVKPSRCVALTKNCQSPA